MTTILAIVFGVLGLIIGSFLNVVICRIGTHKTFGGRSACMSCRSTLAWYDLIPFFSFICLGGKCRSCKSRISWQYPIVELVMGAIFVLLFLKFQNLFFIDTLNFAFSYAYYATLFSILIIISVYDLAHKIIPDELALMFGIVAFCGLFLFSGNVFFPHIPVWREMLGGLIISLPFALMWLISSGRWMGLGDAKLAVGLGFMMGISGMISATLISFWSGAVVGIFLLIFSKKYGKRSEVPFAPFLVLGVLIVFLFNLELLPMLNLP